jgi:hypothetical protein
MDKTLSRTQREIQQTSHGQRTFYRLIRVGILGTALGRALAIPTRQHRSILPQRQAASSDQSGIIRRPVVDAVDRFFLTNLEAFGTLLITGFAGREVRVSVQETTAQSNWKACVVSTRYPRFMQQSPERCTYNLNSHSFICCFCPNLCCCI